MKDASILFTFLLLFTISCTSTEEKIDQANEYEAITYAVDNCIGWFKNKDKDLLLSIVADDSSFLSVHPNDKIVIGRAGFEKSIPIFMNPKFQYVRHEVRDLKINISKSGDVAWFYCKLDDINTWDGQPANWENTRWTGVLEKRNDRWQIVQQHFSFASE